MNYPKAKIDRCSIERATGNGQYYVKAMLDRARLMYEDNDRDARIRESFCVHCYRPYGAGGIGGAACTNRECGLCDTTIHSGSTNIDMLCPKCAVENGLCRHCGADVDLKFRRKARAFEGGK